MEEEAVSKRLVSQLKAKEDPVMLRAWRPSTSLEGSAN